YTTPQTLATGRAATATVHKRENNDRETRTCSADIFASRCGRAGRAERAPRLRQAQFERTSPAHFLLRAFQQGWRVGFGRLEMRGQIPRHRLIPRERPPFPLP